MKFFQLTLKLSCTKTSKNRCGFWKTSTSPCSCSYSTITEKDPWKILNLERNATPSNIKDAFFTEKQVPPKLQRRIATRSLIFIPLISYEPIFHRSISLITSIINYNLTKHPKLLTIRCMSKQILQNAAKRAMYGSGAYKFEDLLAIPTDNDPYKLNLYNEKAIQSLRQIISKNLTHFRQLENQPKVDDATWTSKMEERFQEYLQYPTIPPLITIQNLEKSCFPTVSRLAEGPPSSEGGWYLHHITEDRLFSMGKIGAENASFRDHSAFYWTNEMDVAIVSSVLRSIPSFTNQSHSATPNIPIVDDKTTKNKSSSSLMMSSSKNSKQGRVMRKTKQKRINDEEGEKVRRHEDINTINEMNGRKYYRLELRHERDKAFADLGAIEFVYKPSLPLYSQFIIYNKQNKEVANGSFSNLLVPIISIYSSEDDSLLVQIKRKFAPFLFREYLIEKESETMPFHPSVIMFCFLVSYQIERCSPSPFRFIQKLYSSLFLRKKLSTLELLHSEHQSSDHNNNIKKNNK